MKNNTSRAIIGMFYNRLNAILGASWAMKISHFNGNSDQNSEEYIQAGATPQFQPWRGKRGVKEISFESLIVMNEKYEATLRDLVDNFRYDKSGQLMSRVNGFATRAVTHWAKLLTDVIKLGGSTVGADGKAFFSSAHHANQKNDLAAGDNAVFDVATATNPTAVELADIIGELVAHMQSFLDDQNEPMNEGASSFLLMVPPNMARVASVVATKGVISDASGAKDNPLIDAGFTLDVQSNARLTATADKSKLYLFRTDGDTKPALLQERGGVTMSAKAEGSDFEHDTDMWEFGAKSNRGVGLFNWENAIRATLS